MGTQKQKRTKAARNQRRSHHALKKLNSVKCEKCGSVIRPHRACSKCGYYKGRAVIDVSKKLSPREKKLAKKAAEKAEKSKEKEAAK